jgi:hypothetical protein
MGFSTKLLVGGVVAGAALAYYVKQRHESTGAGYFAVARQLPADAQRWAADARRRAARALEEGRSAARAREAEIDRQLTAARPPRTSV